MPRLRQAVLAARDLDPVVASLRESLQLGEPFNDPGVALFGLRNAVFAIGDTFLEVVSPIQPDTSAGRLLDRRGGDCGYMVMFQVPDLDAAKARASARSIRQVFDVELDDIAEVHLHPADISGAIVALSAPSPPESWRWGGPEWEQRTVPGRVAAVTVSAQDPDAVAARWTEVIGEIGAVTFQRGGDQGPIEITIERDVAPTEIELGSVRITATRPT
ncbi:MAG TPA: VOC family protein [Solirubrobacteraceae bacterium]|nr:VOC family protein [Solirubrobacteraceae bacterium]